jgi:hypothetical protein
MTTPAQAQPVPAGAAAVAAGETALAADVAAVLATAATVAGAVAILRPLFVRAGVEPGAVLPSVTIVMGMPPDAAGFHGPATAMAARLNLARRAQFLVAAARRISTDIRQARSEDTPLADILQDIMTRERRYYGQHLQAIWQRNLAASRVDSASMLYGRLLGWNTVHDSHTTRECKAADGHNFWADAMPFIGYPGMTHPQCRCWPGRPFAGAAILPSAALRRMIAA